MVSLIASLFKSLWIIEAARLQKSLIIFLYGAAFTAPVGVFTSFAVVDIHIKALARVFFKASISPFTAIDKNSFLHTLTYSSVFIFNEIIVDKESRFFLAGDRLL